MTFLSSSMTTISITLRGENTKTPSLLPTYLPTSVLDRSVHLYLRSAPTLLPLYLSHAACRSSLPLKMVTPQSLFTLFGMLSLALALLSFLLSTLYLFIYFFYFHPLYSFFSLQLLVFFFFLNITCVLFCICAE